MGGEHFSQARTRNRFRKLLLDWYAENARDLPWRRTSDPYAIWVSEIMLQQTRVNAVLDHYARFLSRFPTVAALADAEEPEVLAIWSGLGYYRRARMLHKAAQFVMKELGGSIPQTAIGLRALPGIGEYTSAAIASIAFGEAAAVVDGNVERVIIRLTALEGESKKSLPRTIRANADELLAPAQSADFNQAMMELGAMICLPQNPLCLHCPVQPLCLTRGEHVTAPRKQMSSRRVAYAFLRRSNRRNRLEVLLEQRPADTSLMAGMWELPQVEEENAADESRVLLRVRHSITTTNYYVSVLLFLPEEKGLLAETASSRKWVRVNELLSLPLTGLTRKVLKRLHVLPGYTPGVVPVQIDDLTDRKS